MQPPASAPEFHRPFRVSGLSKDGRRFRETATEAECAALAARWGVQSVKRFAVEGRLTPDGEGWKLQGRALTRITQSCVVTLDPVDQVIEEPFERLYLPDAPDPDASLDLDIDEEDPPEPLGRDIDVGEAAAVAAALAIDPYPKAKGAGFVEAGAAPKGADPLDDAAVKPQPFAALAALKAKMEGEGD